MKTGFLEKLIERLNRLDPKSLQAQFLRLARERGLLDMIFQSIQEGVIVVDGDGRVAYANRAVESLIGMPVETAVGRPISRFLRDIDWDRILALDTREWTRMIAREIEVSYPEHRILTFYVAPLSRGETGDSGAVVMLRDVTRERLHANTALESERLDAVKLLAAGVAHEIGNPLNALNIHLQLLHREARKLPEPHADSMTELVDIARREVKRLDTIITQFLKAVRPTRPRLAQARLETLIQETLALLRQEIQDRRLRVEIECDSPTPRIRVDRDQIKQAFFNVIRNAMQAMPDGGAITIAVAGTDRFAAVSFQDTGHGIEAANMRRVFDPYFTTKKDGSGLGLMIVQRIVQDHGGQIELVSKPGAGTRVTILLPRLDRRVRLLESPAADARHEEEPEG